MEPSIDEVMRSDQREFHELLGDFITAWSIIEGGLLTWFTVATKMKSETARAVFFSARSFQGRIDMLEAAVEAAPPSIAFHEYVRRVCKTVRSYSLLRNEVVHGHPTFIAHKTSRHFGATVIMQGDYLKDFSDSQPVVTKDDLRRATLTFRKLAFHLLEPLRWDGKSLESSPERHLELILQLPNPPHSTARGQKRE